MKFTPLPLDGAYLIDLDKIEDDRGFFARFFCEKEFTIYGLITRWLQMNTSLTKQQGSIRGLHFQRPPKVEAKLVRCLRGSVWDVMVDLRRNSNTFGKWHETELSENNRSMVYIPEGFAHGFQTLVPDVEMLYFHSDFHSPEHEGGLRYDDPALGIKWPLSVSDISKRDQEHPELSELKPVEL
ncbi:MAG: dTDP-4-dehydrorhamnose 3,5-epimerase [Verrucomicrobia bacterium]|nr:dTDP-4-dehydrorhamnose 3,5-epimerase [Verrucomicrobiota bacterium]